VAFKITTRQDVSEHPRLVDKKYYLKSGELFLVRELSDIQRYTTANTLSLWNILGLEHIASVLEAAKLKGDREFGLAEFQKFQSLVSNGFPISNMHSSRYRQVASRLARLKADLLSEK